MTGGGLGDRSRPTEFQERTEAALVAALDMIGVRLDGRRLDGTNETFIRASVSGTSAEIFIYENEAGLLGPNVDKRFETSDYRDSDGLARHFIAETVHYAKRWLMHEC